MAIGSYTVDDIDAIVMHAPGTIQGDKTEFEAIKKVFGNQLPLLTSNKWKVGHTFATSGLLSVELAILMLQNQYFIETPFYKNQIKNYNYHFFFKLFTNHSKVSGSNLEQETNIHDHN